jgi:TRAP transporter TAXI family solute receptor
VVSSLAELFKQIVGIIGFHVPKGRTQMKKGEKWAVVVVIFALTVFMGITNAYPAEKKLPSLFSVATLGVGSSGYIAIAGAAPILEKSLNAKIRLLPSDVRLTQFKMMKTGEAEWNHSNLATVVKPLYAWDEFATKEWGPQKLGMIYMGGNLILSILVRESSNIKSMKDLKGKKIAVYPGSKLFWTSMLAYANLSMEDVVQIPAGGYTASGKLLLENRVDAVYGAPSSTVYQEVANSPGGIRCLPMPSADKVAWQRVTKAFPAHLPDINPQNYGIKEAWGKELVGYPNAEYAYLTLDERIAYLLTKAFFEGFEKYKTVGGDLKYYSPETALSCLKQPIPYHPGSVKFFKEKKVWTPEHEKWQKEQMGSQEVRLKAWGQAVKGAEGRGMKIARENQEWLDLWQSYLDKI